MVDRNHKDRNDDAANGKGAETGAAGAAEVDLEPGTAAGGAADSNGAEDLDSLQEDFIDVGDGAEVPEELREDEPDPATVPKTGLVSEFHDLTASQAAYLVAHRETSNVARSPLFYVSALVLGLAVVAALVIGFQRTGEAPGGNDTLAVVGVPEEQADAFAQQIGIPVTVAETVEDGQEMLRSGEVGAVYAMDPTGMGQAQLIALDREPAAILEKLNQPLPVEYLEQPAVDSSLADPVAWGLAVVVLLSGLVLGSALYQNLRTEKRNRLAEVIAAAIPPRSSAWGRVYGLTVLSLTFVLVGAGVLLVGLSIGQRTSEAVALMPGLGWFAVIALVTVHLMLAAHLWVSTSASRRVRRIAYGTAVLLAVAGALLPMLFRAERTVTLVLSYIPFSAPVAMPIRYFANQAEWWEGPVAAVATLVVGIVVFVLASAAYRRTLLAGAGRGGRKAAAKLQRKAGKRAGAAGSVRAAETDTGGDTAEAGAGAEGADEAPDEAEDADNTSDSSAKRGE